MQRETDIFGISPHQKNNLCTVIGKKKSFDFDALDTLFFYFISLLTCPVMQNHGYLHRNETKIAKKNNMNNSRQRIFLMIETRKVEIVMKESQNLNLGW